jgi:hypothetical protein
MPRPDPVTSATLFSKSIEIQRIEGREPAGKNGHGQYSGSGPAISRSYDKYYKLI